MILRARHVLPMNRPPLADGAVAIIGDRIVAVGTLAEVHAKWPGPVRDIGDAVLLPGLINAHCHLDYTDMVGQVPWHGDFLDWILRLTALKKQWTEDQYVASINHGLAQLVRGGATTVVNIECFPPLVAKLAPSPLRLWWCPELLDLVWSEESQRLVASAADWLAGQPHGGLSPHAPYTVSEPLYRLAAKLARDHGWLLTTHVAESREEDEMYRWGRGPMFERYRPAGQGGALERVAALGVLGPNCLVAHANLVTADEVELLARSGTSVAHCPRTHRFFARPPAPLTLWRQQGVNVCLGTDSLASNESLDLRAEMRELARAWPALSPREVLAMATVNPATALNRAGELGIIGPGARADLVAVPVDGPTDDPQAAAIWSEQPVNFVMINGKVVLE